MQTRRAQGPALVLRAPGFLAGNLGTLFKARLRSEGVSGRGLPGVSSLTLSRLVSVRTGLTDIFTCYSQIWSFRYRLWKKHARQGAGRQSLPAAQGRAPFSVQGPTLPTPKAHAPTCHLGSSRRCGGQSPSRTHTCTVRASSRLSDAGGLLLWTSCSLPRLGRLRLSTAGIVAWRNPSWRGLSFAF